MKAKENFLFGHFKGCEMGKPHFPHSNGNYQGNCGELDYICVGMKGDNVNFVITKEEEGSPEYAAEFGWVVVEGKNE